MCSLGSKSRSHLFPELEFSSLILNASPAAKPTAQLLNQSAQSHRRISAFINTSDTSKAVNEKHVQLYLLPVSINSMFAHGFSIDERKGETQSTRISISAIQFSVLERVEVAR